MLLEELLVELLEEELFDEELLEPLKIFLRKLPLLLPGEYPLFELLLVPITLNGRLLVLL